MIGKYTPILWKVEENVWIRWAFHFLLAAFLANAANKFFVADLEYEAKNGFYAKIFEFQGDAPDQYRILPLLGLKMLAGYMPFNTAVLTFNFWLSFIFFEGIRMLVLQNLRVQRSKQGRWAIGSSIVFAVGYIFCQYTGWRPDTMGLLVICLGVLLAAGLRKDPATRALLLFIGIIALSFSRADIALVYALFVAIYVFRSWWLRVPLVLIPAGVQALLQFVLFPDARYYSDTIMLKDNLSLFYLLRNPATYLILALVMLYLTDLRDFFRRSLDRFKLFYILVVGYILLVLVVGRLNEYRLYLPILLILIYIRRETGSWHEKKVGRF